jgi:hypothetical protein
VTENDDRDIDGTEDGKFVRFFEKTAFPFQKGNWAVAIILDRLNLNLSPTHREWGWKNQGENSESRVDQAGMQHKCNSTDLAGFGWECWVLRRPPARSWKAQLVFEARSDKGWGR